MEAWPGNTDLWHWTVCKESGMEQSIPDLPVTCYKHIQGSNLPLPLPEVWTILHYDFLSAHKHGSQKAYGEYHGSAKRWKQDTTGHVVHPVEIWSFSYDLAKMWMYTPKHLWTSIRKLYSGSDCYGERCEKLWQREEKHELFLFCIELSFYQEKGYGFLNIFEWELMNKTWGSFLNQVILLRP